MSVNLLRAISAYRKGALLKCSNGRAIPEPQRYPRGCVKTMKTRYRLTRRGIRGDRFYCVDKTTGKRTSLHTANADEARQIVDARNNAERQPVLNLQIAKAYLAGTDNGIA